MISPAIANCPRSAAKFEREAVILRQLQHRNIVSLYDMGKASRELFLVMEYVPGYDALGLMKIEGGQLPIWRAVNFACQALGA